MKKKLVLKVTDIALAGVVQWLSACLQTKGYRFDSQSGHVPGLQAGVPRWGCTRGNHTLMFLSFSFSFPTPFSKNK